MYTIIRTMVTGLFRDAHTLVWNIVFPLALLLGLGFYFDDPSYSERLLAGVLATNVLMGSGMVTAFHVMAQRNRGVYKLLKATPFPTIAFVASMTAARTALALVVSACAAAAGAVFLGAGLTAAGAAALLLVLLVGTVCFTAVGFIAANFSRDEGNVNLISNLIAFPMLLTSEAFYSLDHAPQWVRTVGALQPFHYFVDATAAALRGSWQAGDWKSLAVLACFAACCLAIAALTFRWERDAPLLPFARSNTIRSNRAS